MALFLSLPSTAMTQENPWESTGPFCAPPLSFAAGAALEDPAYLTAGPRLFRSRDGWSSWEEVVLDFPVDENAYLSFVAVDPHDPKALVLGIFAQGLYRSVDGGAHWETSPAGIESRYVEGVSGPGPAGIFYAVLPQEGLFRSSDGGTSWQPVQPAGSPPNFWLMDAPGTNPGRLWLRTGPELWRSDDGARSWVGASNGLPEVDYETDVASHPTRPTTAFLTRRGWLWRTDDAQSWTQQDRIPVVTDHVPFTTPLVALPDGGSTLLVAGQHGDEEFPWQEDLVPGILRSADGGNSWTQTGLVGETPRQFYYHPGSGRIVALTGSGAYFSVDGGISWHQMGAGVASARVSSVVVAEPDTKRVWAAVNDCQWARVARSNDGGASWSTGPPLAQSIRALALAPSDPSVLLADASDGVLRSVDGGETWEYRPFLDNIGGGDVEEIAFHPEDANRVFAASSSRGLAASTDGGQTWQTRLLDSLDLDSLHSVVIDPSDPDQIWVGSDFGVGHSGDGGASWRRLLPSSYVHTIAVSPTSDVILVAALYEAHRVLRSTDGGETWLPSDEGLDASVRALRFSPSEPGVVLAGTEEGVFRSENSGVSWQPWSDGLGPRDVRDVTVSSSGQVIAASYGHGVYRTGPCVPGPTTACLLSGRFRVEGTMSDFSSPPRDVPTRVMAFSGGRAESDQAVFFESFTPGNFEAGVKMVDACGLPDQHPQRAFWVFLGALTNTEAAIRIEDSVTGAAFDWFNPPGELPTSVADTGAFPCVPGLPSCTRDATTACLLGDRFRVSGSMKTFDEPPMEVANRVMMFPAEGRAESDQAVFFESFASGNFEVAVKMVDACGLPEGHPLRAYWVFYGGLTNAGTRIRVTQLGSGISDVWTNPSGQLPTSVVRTGAFQCE